ncbi:rerric reductase like transmembrane component [Aspergillus heteromorphus CBS 117.55]|uniref:Rerric reductase like transmembrane component n=1 Tax=Aspergillus heteromorphus CBS 117.55 TaxID=1448321 RepID=A0A317VGX9_9EURO|nr:rerric reductase like transmembrane component [Aspergillus heteromorphus CBS 117.55]PWY72407.1 rerric reductase like transmembrane component [Aspergillus heteromorphus CBS 117.55]
MSLSWPWHFMTVSDAEKQQRRELLDLRGFYAQCSIVVALVLVRLYKASSSAAPGTEKPAERRSKRKPVEKSWLDSPPVAGWFETRRQYIICLLWLGWLLGLSVWNSGEDYLHFTKALGHVALSQLPLQVLMSPALYLSPKPGSPSIVSVLTTVPQPVINSYHRLFGRLVISPLLVAHAFLYSSFFLQSSHPDYSSLYAKRIRDPDVQWGVAAAAMATAVVLFARPAVMPRWVRWVKPTSAKARQQVFYIVHVLIVGVLELAAYSHVSVARVYIIESFVSSALNFSCCWLFQ